MSIPALASLDGRGYITEMKARLRDDAAWDELLDPTLVERTRWGLNRLIESIEEQKERAVREHDADPGWLRAVNTLQGLAQGRLEGLEGVDARGSATPASSREARAWRGFAARLARVLAEADPAALQRLRTPYGGLTAAEWLSAREEKKS
jgi:hypothetical protein